jgi:death-on-curing protein
VADPVFLTLAEVIEIHRDQIERYGGQAGLRDLALLQSAVAQPEATFAAEWLHPDEYHKAAAYAFHICQNHPFIDGNKRTGLAAALVFLELNDTSILDPKGRLEAAMIDLASGKMSKQEFAGLLRVLPREE